MKLFCIMSIVSILRVTLVTFLYTVSSPAGIVCSQLLFGVLEAAQKLEHTALLLQFSTYTALYHLLLQPQLPFRDSRALCSQPPRVVWGPKLSLIQMSTLQLIDEHKK